MKKIFGILALVILCVFAAFGGITLAIGMDAAKDLVGIASDAPQADMPDNHGQDTDADGEGSTPEETAQDQTGGMPVMPFPEIIVNVTETGSTGRQSSRFLKLNLLMVYDDTVEGAERLVSREVYLRDTFQDFLRQLQVSDLKGSRGLVMMKTELLRRARAVGHTDAPVEILVADMVVQ